MYFYIDIVWTNFYVFSNVKRVIMNHIFILFYQKKLCIYPWLDKFIILRFALKWILPDILLYLCISNERFFSRLFISTLVSSTVIFCLLYKKKSVVSKNVSCVTHLDRLDRSSMIYCDKDERLHFWIGNKIIILYLIVYFHFISHG